MAKTALQSLGPFWRTWNIWLMSGVCCHVCIKVMMVTAAVVAPGSKAFAMTSSPGPLAASRVHVPHGGINRADPPGPPRKGLWPHRHHIPVTYIHAGPHQWWVERVGLLSPLTDNTPRQEILNIVIRAAISSGFSGLLVPALYFWICRNVRMARYQWQEVGARKVIPGVCVTPNASKALLSLSLHGRSEQLIPWFNEIYFWP